MSGARICMLVYNNCTTDARVLKEARALTDAGLRVTIVAVRDQTTPPRERRDGFEIVRIDRNPPHYRLLRWARGLIRLGRLGRAGVARAAEIPFRGPATAEGPTRGELVWRTVRARLQRSRVLLPLLAVPAVAWAAWARARRALHGSTPPRLLEPVALRDSVVFGLPYRLLMLFHKPLMFLDFYRRAYRLMHDERIAAFHAHDLNTLPVAAALARRNGAKLIYDAHELYPDISTLSRSESRIWRQLERLLIGRADEVVTVSQSIADELVARHRVSPPLILLNCPFRPVTVPADRELLRRKIGRDDARPIVLYQGGFAPNRGLAALVRSAHHLDAGLLVLMGWGRLERGLRDLVASEDLGERVVITGPVPHAELLAYTSGAAVGVIPYEPVGLNNTFSAPNKLFDYLAVGLPVVASHLPEIVRFVHGLDVGTTFSAAEPRAIAAAINGVLGDPDAAARMRENALHAGHELCWEVESAKLVDLYVRMTG